MASSSVWWFWLHPTSVISDHRPGAIICKCSSNAHHHLAAVYVSVLASCPHRKDWWGRGKVQKLFRELQKVFRELFFFPVAHESTGNALWGYTCQLTEKISMSDKSSAWGLRPLTSVCWRLGFQLCFLYWLQDLEHAVLPSELWVTPLQDEDNSNASKGKLGGSGRK